MQRTALLRALLLAQVLATLLAWLPGASAQEGCPSPPPEVVGSIGHDGTTPLGMGVVGYRLLPPEPNGGCTQPGCDPEVANGWGSVTVVLPFEGSYDFEGGSAGYLPSWGNGGGSCTRDPENGCLHCGGNFGITLYGAAGNFFGHVYELPRGLVAVDHQVWANDLYRVNTDSEGKYDYAAHLGPPWRANNWALPVYGDGHGPGFGSYVFRVDSDTVHKTRATTTSSKATEVDFTLWTPGYEEPSRCEPPPSNSGPGDGEASTLSPTLPPPEVPTCPACGVGKPVSVTTGAVYFDQTDVTIPGFGTGLRFVRSYNSQLRQPPQYGAFGRGWNFTYEQRLSFPSAGVIMLRKANGNPAYFQNSVPTDPNDLTFEASVPFTKASWIVKEQPGGTYTRHFRSGGEEHYDASGRLTSLVDASNNTTILAYDGSGRLLTITEAVRVNDCETAAAGI